MRKTNILILIMLCTILLSAIASYMLVEKHYILGTMATTSFILNVITFTVAMIKG